MSHPFDPDEHNSGFSDAAAGQHDPAEIAEQAPWDDDLPLEDPDDPDAPRQRHDGFTEAKKAQFIEALVKTGCIAEACRRTGVSRRTVYRHQRLGGSFFDNCCTAIRMAATPIELTAWQRAVEGVEEEVVVRGEVRTRRRYSEGLMRMLLQGSNPRKYGPRPGFKRKRLLKHERKQIEREVRAEYEARHKPVSFDDAVESLANRLRLLNIPIKRPGPESMGEAQLFDAGWTRSPDGHLVPPGYAPIGPSAALLDAPSAPAPAVETDHAPHDSM